MNSKTTFSVLFFFLFSAALFANDYQKGWEALNNNKREEAREHFTNALKDPATAADAALSLLLLETFDGRESKNGAKYWQSANKTLTNPYPYMFAFWFNEALGGDYGVKTDDQIEFLEALTKNPNAPDALRASATYQLGHYQITEGEFKKAHEMWQTTSNLQEWQLVGPFDNLSGSGFDKNYPPIAQPEPTAKFKSTFESDIQWFAPAISDHDGWFTPGMYVRNTTAVTFSQSFVTSPADMDAVLCAGFTGNIRIWVNDKELLSEQEYRRTDYDLYKVKCKLNKGVNRILVQLGYEDTDYPNFCVRLTDSKFNLLPGITSSTQYAAYKKDNSTTKPEVIPFFAETYFLDKIKLQPDNLLNYLLLNKIYLRSQKIQDAIAIIKKAFDMAPGNSLIRYEYIQTLNKNENRTELVERVQQLKDEDPDCLFSLLMRFSEAMDNENYDEATTIMDRHEQLYGKSSTTYQQRIRLAASKEEMEKFLSLIDEAADKYPTVPNFNDLRHSIAIHLRKDPNLAISIDEKFLKKNYHIETAKRVIEECFETGRTDKALRRLNELSEGFEGDQVFLNNLYNYYYGIKDNKKAKSVAEQLLGQAPFNANYHEKSAKLFLQMDKNEEALAAFKKALHYNPNDFDVRRRLRELEDQTDLTAQLPQNDVYALIKKSDPKKMGDYDWYYVLDQKATIIYPERCSETYYTVAVKILNDEGINDWKETSLGYNPYRQRLIVEKAEVVKPNGNKVPGEQNDNELVFANLEVGDAVYFYYRIINYAYGRMGREYWDDYAFNTVVPSEISRYSLLISNSVPVQYKTMNLDLEATVKTIDDFKLYTWELQREAAFKPENLMPRYEDVNKHLYVSTMKNWADVANWYADLSVTQAKAHFDVKQAIAGLFPEGKTFTQMQKARMIYDYIVKNITYSSVPFRQSAFVPQSASRVLQTKLGDCKDVSTLYAAMAREVGLSTNLVLVSTRDNGENSLTLPSVEFNHCIVKVMVDGTPWYLELTNPYLPFGSLPNEDFGALTLEIPYNTKVTEAGLFKLEPNNRTRDKRSQKTVIDIKNRDLHVQLTDISSGALTSDVRSNYITANKDEKLENVRKVIGGRFTNQVTVKDVTLGALDQLNDTLHYQVQYSVRNEIIEIGDLRTFKVPFYYYFLNASAFQEDTRIFPINYRAYEDADEYEEDITINVPADRQITEVPKNVNLSFNGSQYTLEYVKKSPTSLQVTRRIKINRANIAVQDYEKFKVFLDEVVAAETRYVAFK